MVAGRSPADPCYWGLPSELGRLDSGPTPRLPARRGSVNPSAILRAEFPAFVSRINSAPLPYQLYLETRPPAAEAMSWGGGWHADAQRAFDANWPSELNSFVDGLIEEYGSQWHNAFQATVGSRYPDFVMTLKRLAKSGELKSSELDALREGPVRTTMQRRSWPYPNALRCQVCGEPHFADFIRYYLIRDYGRPGVCMLCRYAAYEGSDDDGVATPAERRAGLDALAQLAQVTEAVPPQSFRRVMTTVGMSDERRARVVAALICTPNAEQLRRQADGAPWLKVLQDAGIVGDTWRPARGVICTALDGHPCRSLGERSIDDWLSRRGIAHQCEPRYPKHPKLNPGGRLRADWSVGDVLIEYAGMLGDKAYVAKMETKRKLAVSVGADLLVLAPEDLYDLDRVLSRLL